MNLAKAVSLSNILIWIWAAYRAVARKDTKPFWALLGLSVLADVLKKTFRVPRPSGAKGCDMLGVKGPSKTFGMPSGHVATTVAGVMMIASLEFPQLSDFTVGLLGLIAGILMSWSRISINCHATDQCVVGGLLGWGWFMAMY